MKLLILNKKKMLTRVTAKCELGWKILVSVLFLTYILLRSNMGKRSEYKLYGRRFSYM